jgi:NAD(P) transhydrogenase subunit alpha
MSKTIAIPKETRIEETRVAITPDGAKKLRALGYKVKVQKNAGIKAGFSNPEYLFSNAEIIEEVPSLLAAANIVLPLKRPAAEIEKQTIATLVPEALIVGFLDPYFQKGKHLHFYQKQKVTAFAFELLPNLPETQLFDPMAHMSQITGEVVLDDYIENYNENLEGKKILIIGLGNVGLSCAKYAWEKKAKVTTITRSDRYRNLVAKQGGRFLKIEGNAESKKREFVEKILLTNFFDLVVCSARIRCQLAPLLISKSALLKLQKKVIIYDLAASLGGNCEASQYGKNTSCGGADVRSKTGYPTSRPKEASERYSSCVIEFLKHLSRDSDDSITQLCLESCAVCNGMVNPILGLNENYQINDGIKFRDRLLEWHSNYLKTWQ